MRKPLKELTVLVTRPKDQAQQLSAAIKSLGGHVVGLPTIMVLPIADQWPLLSIIRRLDLMDMAIFVSGNAIKHSVELIQSHWPSWPQHIEIVAIGQATAKALTTMGYVVAHCPSEQFSSEALLELEALSEVKDKNIVIFCGENPRPLLLTTLRKRGATVVKAEAYQRSLPKYSKKRIEQLYQHDSIDIIIATSATSVTNLAKLVGRKGKAWLQSKPLIVVSERIAKCARQQGIKHLWVTENASDDDIINALIHFTT